MTQAPRSKQVPAAQIRAMANTIPGDLVALELQRRRIKARTKPDRCRYKLYRAEKEISTHWWIDARRDNWRTARKALKFAADRLELLP